MLDAKEVSHRQQQPPIMCYIILIVILILMIPRTCEVGEKTGGWDTNISLMGTPLMTRPTSAITKYIRCWLRQRMTEEGFYCVLLHVHTFQTLLCNFMMYICIYGVTDNHGRTAIDKYQKARTRQTLARHWRLFQTLNIERSTWAAMQYQRSDSCRTAIAYIKIFIFRQVIIIPRYWQ